MSKLGGNKRDSFVGSFIHISSESVDDELGKVIEASISWSTGLFGSIWAG